MYWTPAIPFGVSLLEAFCFLEQLEHQVQALHREVTCPECDSRSLDSWVHYDYKVENLVWGISYSCGDCGYEWRSM